MSVKPIIAVIGHKKSGKTSLIEDLIRSLRSEGLKVMSASMSTLKASRWIKSKPILGDTPRRGLTQ